MSHSLIELGRVFLRIGATSFGGPAAHLALMEEELVRRRAWLTHPEFLDLIGAANLVPGPNSTEVALHVGRVRAGPRGLIVAGVCMILPAFISVLMIAWFYVRFGSRPRVAGVLDGIKPVVLAVVAQALIRVGRPALGRSRVCCVLGFAALAASLMYPGRDLAIVMCAGILSIAWTERSFRIGRGGGAGLVLAATRAAAVGAASIAVPSTLGLFLVCFRIGATLFGSGYVLLSYLRSEFVIARGWLSETQILDAVAVGQVTPGPLFTSATFVGYLLGGWIGAIAATVGIFLPAFLLVAVSGPLVPILRRSRGTAAFLDGVNAASVGLMAAVTIGIGMSTKDDPAAIALFIAACLALFDGRIGSVRLILIGAVLGVLRTLF